MRRLQMLWYGLKVDPYLYSRHQKQMHVLVLRFAAAEVGDADPMGTHI